jgi:thiamine monophosphate synthase
MLQYIIKGKDRATVELISQQALESSCKWIRLDVGLLPDSDIENCVKNLHQLCQKHECILTIEENVQDVKNWNVDGSHLGLDFSSKPTIARKELGEEPILGMTIKEASDVPFLPKSAIDYVEIDGGNQEECRKIVAQMKTTGLEEPVVARLGVITQVRQVMETGVNGIALEHSVDNLEKLHEIIDELEKIAQSRLAGLD